MTERVPSLESGQITPPQHSSSDKKRSETSIGKRWILSLALFALTLLVFLPVRHNGFISFDDGQYVSDNFYVKSGLNWSSVSWAFRTWVGGSWHPLTWLSLMLDCQLFGLNPGAHHLMNVFYHAIDTVLLFLLFNCLTRSIWRSAFVAIFFAIHPLHVESVAWASERKDTLCAFFYLGALLLYTLYVRRLESGQPRAKLFYGLTFLCFICGLMSKPMIVTLPVILLLLDWWPLYRLRPEFVRRLLIEKIPFFAAALAMAIVTFLTQKQIGAMQVGSHIPILLRCANVLLSYANYLFQTVWPAHLAVYYPYPRGFWFWSVAGSALLLLAASAVAFSSARSRPYLAFGWVWYVVTLLPVIGFVQVGHQAHADRYTYLPLVGIFAIIAWTAYDLTKNLKFQSVILSSLATGISALLIVLTHRQIGYWKDNQSIYGHALEVTRNNVLALNNLGVALLKERRVDEAIARFREGSVLEPSWPTLHFSLGDALMANGSVDEGRFHFREALRRNPHDAETHCEYAKRRANEGFHEEAISEYKEALRLKPAYVGARVNLGIALVKLHRLDEAIEEFAAAARLIPDDPIVNLNLGSALAQKGAIFEAESYFTRALRFAPNDEQAHASLGMVLGRLGRLHEAKTHLEIALALNPTNSDAHCNLGITLGKQRLVDDAIGEFQQALTFNASNAEAHCNLGVAYGSKGRISEAIVELREALKFKPVYPDAEINLRMALDAATNNAAAHP